MMTPHITALDHLVLTVRDVEAMCAFYAEVLGMEILTFAEGRKALRFGAGKINLHPISAPFEPHAKQPALGAADLCFIVRQDVQTLAEALQARGIVLLGPPVVRTGAVGAILSIYFYDPEGNLIELANYLHEEALLK